MNVNEEGTEKYEVIPCQGPGAHLPRFSTLHWVGSLLRNGKNPDRYSDSTVNTGR